MERDAEFIAKLAKRVGTPEDWSLEQIEEAIRNAFASRLPEATAEALAKEAMDKHCAAIEAELDT